jgi:hypothetical protein
MRSFIIILAALSLVCAQGRIYDLHIRPAGVVEELKVLNSGCEIWVKTSMHEYILNGCYELNVSDTLFVYWVNGKSEYVGRKMDKNLFRILSSK